MVSSSTFVEMLFGYLIGLGATGFQIKQGMIANDFCQFGGIGWVWLVTFVEIAQSVTETPLTLVTSLLNKEKVKIE